MIANSSSSSSTTTLLRLYRILQRQVLCMRSQQGLVLLQPPLDPHQAGSSAIRTIPTATVEELIKFFSSGDSDSETRPTTVSDVYWTTVLDLKQAVRQGFRRRNSNPASSTQQHAWAIASYQQLRQQADLMKTTSISCQRNVRIAATSRCVGRTLQQVDGKYRFAYRIRIENLSDDWIQLLGRTWVINEDNANEIRVQAPNTGAVGKLPVLAPTAVFEYMSGCELSTPQGVMKGCFHLCKVPEHTESALVGTVIDAFESPECFEVAVQPFPLQAAEDMMAF